MLTWSVAVRREHQVLSEISINSWQRFWDNCDTGRYTYDLIPAVGSKAIFPKSRDIGILYSCMLLHDTMLKHNSHRTGTSDSPQCDCGMAVETVEHFPLHCCKYYNERQEMLNSINDIVCSPKYKGCLRVSKNMLLSPTASDGVSKKDNLFIKKALFEFLAKTKQSI